tara:strand:+ start:1392 stop:1568 length:177 start_codon:yes stop_codon:yes gene_type:complete
MTVVEQIESLLKINNGDSKQGMAYLIGIVGILEEKIKKHEPCATLEEFLLKEGENENK